LAVFFAFDVGVPPSKDLQVETVHHELAHHRGELGFAGEVDSGGGLTGLQASGRYALLVLELHAEGLTVDVTFEPNVGDPPACGVLQPSVLAAQAPPDHFQDSALAFEVVAGQAPQP